MSGDDGDREWTALMRSLKQVQHPLAIIHSITLISVYRQLGAGMHDLNATRLHRGDPVECARVMRMLVFEVSREVSYQVRHPRPGHYVTSAQSYGVPELFIPAFLTDGAPRLRLLILGPQTGTESDAVWY